MESVIGYLLIALMGVCLGLMGAGGSLLSVPILVYLFHVEPTIATTYATVVVGVVALAGSARSLFSRSVDVRMVVVFGFPCLVGAYLSRVFLLSRMPEVILVIPSFVLTKDMGVMLLFSLTMVLAGVSLFAWRNGAHAGASRRLWVLMPMGLMVGALTGVVGVGGGFLIVPVLVLVGGMDVTRAVGTSLTIIAIKSIFSIFADLSAGVELQWPLFLSLVAVGVPGVVLGSWLTRRVKAVTFKVAFGLVVGCAGGALTVHQLVMVLYQKT